MNNTPLDKLTATKITFKNGCFKVYYHETCVVSASPQTHKVTLNTGGHFTKVTMDRMNQAAYETGLDFSVYQKKNVWHVDVNPNGNPFDSYLRTVDFDGNIATFTVL